MRWEGISWVEACVSRCTGMGRPHSAKAVTVKGGASLLGWSSWGTVPTALMLCRGIRGMKVLLVACPGKECRAGMAGKGSDGVGVGVVADTDDGCSLCARRGCDTGVPREDGVVVGL